MMKMILKLSLLLLITTSLLTIYSFADFDLKVWDIKVKKTRIREFFMDIPENPFGKPIMQEDWKITKKSIKEPMDSSSQKILLIGDSMLEGLMLRMKDYTAYNHHELKTVIWYSSSTEYFGRSDTLRYFINQYKPSYVMLVLGANELFVSDIIRKRKPYIRYILQQIDTLNYVWIGPPNWKDDTGINQLILNSVGKSRYFPSKDLNYQRTSDGAHPTKSSSAIWMDSVAVWIMRESQKPILMNVPDKKNTKSGNVTILQPLN